MLGNSNPLKVKEYMAGGDFIFRQPEAGEEFILVPHQYYSAESQPFIEVHKNGKITRTINANYVKEIRFFDYCGKS